MNGMWIQDRVDAIRPMPGLLARVGVAIALIQAIVAVTR